MKLNKGTFIASALMSLFGWMNRANSATCTGTWTVKGIFFDTTVSKTQNCPPETPDWGYYTGCSCNVGGAYYSGQWKYNEYDVRCNYKFASSLQTWAISPPTSSDILLSSCSFSNNTQ